MEVLNMEDWSKDARDMGVLETRQQHPSFMGKGGEHEDNCNPSSLPLADSGSDPRAWLAPLQPSATCAAHAASPDYLPHSPCPSSGSYQGKSITSEAHIQGHTF